MKIKGKVVLFALASLLSVSSFGEGLPSLGKAEEIVTGEYPNGIKYYLVRNKDSFGVADFALVQNCHTPEQKLRESLKKTRHFISPSPYEFLISQGVGYSRNGFVDSRRSSTIYRFEDVPVTDSYAVDSLLMLIFDFCEFCPSSQAIIISGDISTDEIKGKMSIFSMTVPSRKPFEPYIDYEWFPMEDLTFVERTSSNLRASTISATYSIPRTPSSALESVQVCASKLLYGELSVILRRRLEDRFLKEDIPLAEVNADYVGSDETEGDESYRISICVGKENIERATRILGEVLAGLDISGVNFNELSYAHDVYLKGLKQDGMKHSRGDSYFVDKCISSYLYGTDLATDSMEYSFLSKKDCSSLENLGFFNKFVSVLIDPRKNLVLEYDTPFENLSREALVEEFTKAWTSSPEELFMPFHKPQPLDSLSQGLLKRKVKLKSETTEPITGGKLWTFSNGLRVIFKSTPGTGDFNYSVMVRGGFPSIDGISEGEGAFVSDVMTLFNLPHFSCYDIRREFQREGIVFNPQISISDMRIGGYSESSKYKDVLNAILSYSVSSRPNGDAFQYYMDTEPLRIDGGHNQDKGIEASLDKIMRPDYVYSQYKYRENLSEDLQAKTVPYLRKQVTRLGDGIMVFIGDVEELDILEWFKSYGGNFKADYSFAARPQAKYNLRSGGEKYISKASEGEREGVYVMSSTVVPVTAERYLSFRIACSLLQRELSRRLGECGYYCKVEGNYETYPQERLTVLASCHPAPRSGLPSGIRIASADKVLSIVGSTLREASGMEITEKDVESLKAVLSSELESELSTSRAKIDMVLTRYSEGKDLFSRHTEFMKLVNVDKVKEVLSSVTSDCSVEYIVER